MLSDAECIETVKLLNTLPRAIPVFGGVAEDAVIYGKLTRPHGDVDVFVNRDEWSERLAELRTAGFGEPELYYEIAGKPIVYALDAGSCHVEVYLYERDGSGEAYGEAEGGDGAVYRMYLPGGAFDGYTAMLDGIPISAVTPLALFIVRAASEAIGAWGEHRPFDEVNQRALKERFLSSMDDDELRPRLERV